jgi:hypothetical protein
MRQDSAVYQAQDLEQFSRLEHFRASREPPYQIFPSGNNFFGIWICVAGLVVGIPMGVSILQPMLNTPSLKAIDEYDAINSISSDAI